MPVVQLHPVKRSWLLSLGCGLDGAGHIPRYDGPYEVIVLTGLTRGGCVCAAEQPAEEPGHRRGVQEVFSEYVGDDVRLQVQWAPVRCRVPVTAGRFSADLG
jgi:hypothetical protein